MNLCACCHECCFAGAPMNIACTLKADGDLFLFPNEDMTDAVSSIDDTSPNHQHDSLNSLAEPLSGYVDGMDHDEGEEYFNDEDFCVLDDPGMGVLVSLTGKFILSYLICPYVGLLVLQLNIYTVCSSTFT